jgi:uncharacterized protein (TIGR03435 family)
MAKLPNLIMSIALALVAPSIVAQSAQPSPTPKFEVASIRLCKDTPAQGQRSGGGNSSPGRLNIGCTPVRGLINQAYLLFATGRFRVGLPPPIDGGPAWINSESYEINARAEASVSLEMMNGPMLQSLLEDRFKLKIRSETREVPVYALTVAKSGPKLQPFKEGSCTPVDRTQFVPFHPPTPDQVLANCHATGRNSGPNLRVEAQGMSIADFAKIFLDSHTVDRPVIDKTGITGLFDFHLEYAPDRGAPSDDPATGPSIFTALQEQLGLKLEPSKGPQEFLVIDSVERPSEN